MAEKDNEKKENGLNDYGIIYISGAINGDTAESVCKEIINLNIKGEVNQIQLIINSPGGSCAAGFSIIDIMEWSRIPIYTTGIGMIAEEMPNPIGAEFSIVYDEMAYGLDLRQALEKLGDRLRHHVIDYLIVAMRVQHGTGGNLAEVLTSLSDVLRERLRLQGKVKALSAESRLSGKLLSGLPVLVVLVLAYINPHYYDEAWTNMYLASILAGAGGLLLLGILLLRRFVNNIR